MNRAREKRARGGYARNFQLPAHRTERVKRASQLSRERTREGDKERERAFEMEMKGKHEERKRGRGKKREIDKNSRVIGRSISESAQCFPFSWAIPDGNYYLLTFPYDRARYYSPSRYPSIEMEEKY